MFVILAPISHAMLSPHSWYATAHCACPHRDGRLSWPGWLVTYQDGLPATVTHSRVGCGVTLFETNALTLNQSSTCTHIFSCSLQFNGPVSWLWSGLQKMTERDLKDQRAWEDTARYSERRFGRDGCGLQWRKRDCQRSCQMETTRHPMLRLEQQSKKVNRLISQWSNGKRIDFYLKLYLLHFYWRRKMLISMCIVQRHCWQTAAKMARNWRKMCAKINTC